LPWSGFNCSCAAVNGVLGFVPVLGSLLLIPPLVLFLVLANSLKAASM
jgi:hypothetical protein